MYFSTNIERTMVANLANEPDTYFYYTQLSLEGNSSILEKFCLLFISKLKCLETLVVVVVF